MMKTEEELFPDYDWEVDICCARCGSPYYLVADEESEEIYCGPCLDFMRHHPARLPLAFEIDEEDDLIL
jgi:hypothetical protein